MAFLSLLEACGKGPAIARGRMDDPPASVLCHPCVFDLYRAFAGITWVPVSS